MKDIIETMEQNETNKQDKINPAHYKERTSIECIDAMRIAFGDMDVAIYCIINAYKYLWRHKHKNKLEDLKKAETIKELVKKGREEYKHGKSY